MSEIKKGTRVRTTTSTLVLYQVCWSHRMMVRAWANRRNRKTTPDQVFVEAGRAGVVVSTRPGASIVHWDDDTGSGVANTALEVI
jgi:hypothetical protein